MEGLDDFWSTRRKLTTSVFLNSPQFLVGCTEHLLNEWMNRTKSFQFFIHSAFGYYDVLDPSLGTGNTNRSTSSSASRSKGGEDEVAAETPTTHWIRNFSQCGPQVAGRALPTPACSRQAAPNPPPLTSCAVLFHTSLPNSFSPVGFQKLLVMSL